MQKLKELTGKRSVVICETENTVRRKKIKKSKSQDFVGVVMMGRVEIEKKMRVGLASRLVIKVLRDKLSQHLD